MYTDINLLIEDWLYFLGLAGMKDLFSLMGKKDQLSPRTARFCRRPMSAGAKLQKYGVQPGWFKR